MTSKTKLLQEVCRLWGLRDPPPPATDPPSLIGRKAIRRAWRKAKPGR